LIQTQLPEKKTLLPDGIKAVTEEVHSLLQPKLIASYTGAKRQQDLSKLAPWKVIKYQDKLYVGLPSNYKDLLNKSYLYVAFLAAVDRQKMIMAELDQEFTHTFSLTPEKDQWLKGFTSILVNGEIPTYEGAGQKQYFQGVGCAIRYMMDEIKDLKPDWFSIGHDKVASTTIFGDPWGGKFKTEKRMLDQVISTIKKIPLDFAKLGEYQISYKAWCEKYRVSSKLHENPVLSDMERQWIVHDYKGTAKAIDEKQYTHTCTSKDGYLAYQKQLEKLLKGFNSYKTFVDHIIDKRMKSIYSYQGNKQKRGGKKVPIKDLIAKMRYTREYLESFNPTLVAGGNSVYYIVGYPSNKEERTKFLDNLDKWLNKQVQQGLDGSRAEGIMGWFQIEIPIE